ncbi:conserved hypothetical protein [Methylococcus capsulatus str. Bath]|uniref:DUF1826 domain-containing protein n=1 Tax=Methylococcus capsulatus (strain ATCC 33009 / NCIMB 11132 / Bath) TaxID=243233 RepID=Q605G4_METCA|nr:DUF1826 domain-containing protein [Methylococcus capsulatus]AAU91619.1 conserved hypothetical protein [Methylococcus capsulatus str. Bath]
MPAHRYAMNAGAPRETPAVRTAVVSDDIADLACIYQPDVNLCLIRREPEPAIERFVGELLKRGEAIESSQALSFEHFDFSSLLPEYRALEGHDPWWRDVARLTVAFCDLFETGSVGLRLRTLNQAMCPRFHVDFVPCRLVCTYGGLGTEWLADDEVDRSKLGLAGSKGLADEDSGLILGRVRAMPAHAVALMKGATWAGRDYPGVVHRSPRPTSEQPRRLLLTLDLVL